jgi:general secretion pathway protein H
MGRGAAPLADQRGFTLLEVIVVLVIISLAVGLTIPAIGRSTETIRVRAEVASFSAVMRHARERAIVSHQPHVVVVDPVARRLRLVAGGPQGEVRESRSLSENLTIVADAPALAVRFEPQGGSSGGDFRLSSGTIAYRVTVDGLTGRVRSVRE